MSVSRGQVADTRGGREGAGTAVAEVVEGGDEGRAGVRARTMRHMLDTAIALMQAGANPSVSDVAEAAGVSRATSYRYFPSQAALVDAVVQAALGPILEWQPQGPDADARVAELLAVSLRRLGEFEATFRAALALSLRQWAERRAGMADAGAPLRRGNRVELLGAAVAPLRGTVPPAELDRLSRALSLVFGIESFVVLKDIWGLDQDETENTLNWVAQTLIAAVARPDGS